MVWACAPCTAIPSGGLRTTERIFGASLISQLRIASVAAGLLLACSEESPACYGTTSDALQGSSSTAALVQADGDSLGAIVGLALASSDGSEIRYCTGTVVAAGAILTAAHCVPGELGQGELIIGGQPVAFAPSSTAIHPTLDLAAVFVDPEGVAELDVIAPIPIGVEEPPVTGELVQLAGYGDTPAWQALTANFAVEQVVAVTDETIEVSGMGFSGACAGDSGGPILSRKLDGAIRITALLSFGHSSCRATDGYQRLDVVADWLEATLGAIPTDGVPHDCGVLTEEGVCQGDSAIYCHEGTAVSERCSEESPCGWSGSQQGFRCLALEDDPCRGVSSFGECYGSMTLRCRRGEVVVTECAQCGGGECVRSPRTGAVTCFRE